jgi:predicted RND superfamily exporter protein
MKYVKAFYRFWYDFIVGDDWRLAVGAGSALGASALFVHFGVWAWWFLPLATVGLLGLSVWRGTRARQ